MPDRHQPEEHDVTDDEIKEAIRADFQVDLDNLSCTDKLAEMLDDDEPDGGPDYDRANELLSGARIEIRWATDATLPKFAVDQSVQLMVCAEVVDVVITGVSQEEQGFNYAIQDAEGNSASCWEHELRVATTGSER